MRFIIKSVIMAMVVLAFVPVSTRADTQLWSTPTGDWSVVDNWTNITTPDSTRVPTNGDDVVVTNAAALVRLTNSTAWLSSLIISNATVSCSNWDTTIYVTNLTILKSGVLTCDGPFTNNAVTNRVSLNCSNLYIETNGSINVKGKGYSSGISTAAGAYPSGNGPGGGNAFGANYMVGGGYGGVGVSGSSGKLSSNVYGSATVPLYPGSGGQGGNEADRVGSHGGGAVCITADQVVVNGTINADGSVIPTYWGHASGGSGGGIFITCRTITGTNGAITASGGDAYQTADIYGGGGGGGRIAVIYDSAAQSNLASVPSLQFSAASGISSYARSRYRPGDIGTLYFPDSYFFSITNLFNGQWLAPVPTNIALSELVVSNVWSRMAMMTLTVTNTLTVVGTNYARHRLEFTNEATIRCGQLQINGAMLVLGNISYAATPTANEHYLANLNLTTSGPTLNCSGNLTLINTSLFSVAAGLTNSGAEAGYGARVIVGGDLTIATNCWILPVAHSTNGSVVLFNIRNLLINAGGGFNADKLGYAGGRWIGSYAGNVAYGPGMAVNTQTSNQYANAGSSYGGMGSVGKKVESGSGLAASPVYGSSNMPVDPGSGARAGWASGSENGPYGGGSVQIRASENVTIQGTVSANGGNGVTSYGPGSSGGGIYIACYTFIGDSNGMLSAFGGNGCYTNGNSNTGGGAGGGRIAVWRIFDRSATPIPNYAYGGIDYAQTNVSTAAPGTIVWGWMVPPNGSIVTVY